MSKLSTWEVEQLLENHRFERPEREDYRYTKTPGGGYDYVPTGVTFPAYSEAIADEDGEIDWHVWADELYSEGSTVEVEGLGTVTMEEDHGGEGQGDNYFLILKVLVADGGEIRYFKKPGWYASFDGGHYDGDLQEVKPTQRLVTFYE